MWLLFLQATTWKSRPADILAIDDEVVAYCLDQAVHFIGTTIRGDLEAVEGKTQQEMDQKRQGVLNKYFSDGEPARQFADPALFFK